MSEDICLLAAHICDLEGILAGPQLNSLFAGYRGLRDLTSTPQPPRPAAGLRECDGMHCKQIPDLRMLGDETSGQGFIS